MVVTAIVFQRSNLRSRSPFCFIMYGLGCLEETYSKYLMCISFRKVIMARRSCNTSRDL